MGDIPVIDTKKVKARLQVLRDDLKEVAAVSSASRKPVELDQSSVGRLSRMDAMQGQAMALEIERRRQVEIRRIDAALRRIDDGGYGFCVTCDEDIEAKRLDLDPATPQCLSCARG